MFNLIIQLRKAEKHTVYYDGEATFALARLYELTGERQWLTAACAALDHFIAADYTKYKDHWVAYSINEVTKHVPKREESFAFGLKNASVNMQSIVAQETTYHVFLELLMAAFELYDRMRRAGMDTGDFDAKALVNAISIRARRQLDGFFFPEYAMYMANPRRILHTFMVRHHSWRVRIDDVQHNIGGYYLYWKNYDRLIGCGMSPLAPPPPFR